MARKKPNTAPFWRFLFLIYALVLLCLLFYRSSRWDPELGYQQLLQSGSNFTPLYTIRNYVNIILHYPNSVYYRHCIINLVGNILLFIPIGFFPPRIFHKTARFFPFIAVCFGCLLLVETLQLLTLTGSFDVDDILLNMTGALLGFALSKLFGFKK